MHVRVREMGSRRWIRITWVALCVAVIVAGPSGAQAWIGRVGGAAESTVSAGSGVPQSLPTHLRTLRLTARTVGRGTAKSSSGARRVSPPPRGTLRWLGAQAPFVAEQAQMGTALSAPASPDLATSTGFAGIAQCEYICGEPPDPWVAVGPHHVVQAVNQQIRISSRTGSTIATQGLSAFFGEPSTPAQLNGGGFDPHIDYVASFNRWIASEVSYDCSAGHLYLAISSTADPTGNWTAYRIDFAGTVPDYPGLGASSDKVVLSANQFAITGGCSFGAFSGSTVDVVDSADLLAGKQSISLTEAGPSMGFFSWRPALSLSNTSALHLVYLDSASGDVGYGRITGTNSTGSLSFSVLDTTSIGLAPFASPPVPAGSTGFAPITVDGRPTDALWMDNVLWFTSTYPCIPAGDTVLHDCVRITSLGTAAATPTVAQDFLIGSSGKDYFMGGIGLASDGTLFMVFSVSSITDFIGSYASIQFPVDPPNTYRVPLLLLHGGGSTYSGSRWGDYVGVAQDPIDTHRVWQADEYANVSGHWATWISQLRGVFTDIGTSIFVNDIIWLYHSRITSGCSPTTYCPDAPVTRGQMAAFLDRALNLPATSTDYFTDDEGSLFETDINRLAAAGITSGCTATTYCPDANVTRGQMAAYLDRALNLASTTTDYFTDDEGSLFETDINRLAAAGITSGCTATTYCPDQLVTRGQMAAFLHRAFG